MIECMSGIVRNVQPGWIILDVKGVWYKVIMSVNDTYSECARVDSDHYQLFWVIEHMTINGSKVEKKIFGFKDSRERDLVLLIADKVSGVGVGTVMKIFNEMDGQDFEQAIAHGDTKAIMKCKGLGKKNAERMVTELKSFFEAEDRVDKIKNPNIDDAVATLQALGYKKQEAMDAVNKMSDKVSEDTTAEEIIKLVMKR